MSNRTEEKRRNKQEWRPARRWESWPQRILRVVLNESNLGDMTPGEVYDATANAVLQDRYADWKDYRDAEKEMKRLEKRWEWACRHAGDTAAQIAARLDLEAGILRWAMDELAEVLQEGNRYGKRANEG